MATPPGPPHRELVYTWTEASRKFSIHIDSNTLGHLALESWIAYKRVPRRGLEIGGILTGRTQVDSETTAFWIEGFQCVESEHRSGPSYVLSDSDFALFHSTLLPIAAKSVGIYRSQTRSEQLIPQGTDDQLFENCFAGGDALFLMIGPVPGVAAFFVKADGAFRCVWEFSLASLLSAMLRGGQAAPERIREAPERVPPPSNYRDRESLPREPREDQDQQATPLAPVEMGLGSRPAPPERETRSTADELFPTTVPDWALRFRDAWAAHKSIVKKGAWALAAAIALMVILHFRSSSARPILGAGSGADHRSPEYIHLSVQRAGSSLRLSWDRNSPAVSGAARAVLHIQDGVVQSDRTLTLAEFDSGGLTYQPMSAEVAFRLDVYATEPSAFGVAQVMLPENPSAEAQPLEPNTADRPINALPAAKPAPLRADAPVAARINTKPSDNQTESDDQQRKPVAAVLNTPSGNPPPINEPAAPPVQVAAHPAQPSGERINTGERLKAVERLKDDQQNIQRPPPDVPVEVLAEPVQGNRLGHLVAKIPVIRRFKKTDKSVAPIPLYKGQPSFKKSDAASLTAPVFVDVKVDVGESGSVLEAGVIDYGNPPNFTLAQSALDAARRWTFSPARVDGLAVRGEVVLHFHFYPEPLQSARDSAKALF